MKEVWKVVIGSNAPGETDKNTWYVFARNAAEAERRGLAVDKKAEYKIKKPACYSAAFELNVEE